MHKQVSFHGAINDRTGYGIHATNFVRELSKLIPVNIDGSGGVHISLLDTVTASHNTLRQPYPSILYNAWESTEYPAEFMDKLKLYDQLWVPSEWQRACSIAQGIPEEFVKVVPEGVDPEIYKPNDALPLSDTFDFLHVGQWQPRKSTLEIIKAFLNAFPAHKTSLGYQNVRLYLSVDTLFPSDSYSSTEERLSANGISDSRIIPIHYEPREAYIRRLQSSHVFVSCARAEGWGLPIIEAMASGIPTIVCDYSGSTEYAGNAIRVPVKSMIKPFGIYGNWEVPGQWAEPDYDVLVQAMRNAYEFYSQHKKDALAESEVIRTKFSWSAAAQKAHDIIQSIPECPVSSEVNILADPGPEEMVRRYARTFGYEIDSMSRRNVIFTVDSHPDTPEKMECLAETIKQIKTFGYPVLVATHFPLTKEVMELTDYYIYDKKDILSGEDLPVYWRRRNDGTIETAKASIPCHALGATHNVRNAIDFCLGKYDWVYHMSSDCEADLGEWLFKVNSSTKPLIGCHWGTDEASFGGQLIAGKTDVMDKIILHIDTWAEFAEIFGEDRFCSERGLYKIVAEKIGLENVDFIPMELGNRFDQVDRDVWKDDQFECHFCEGPYLKISGFGTRDYEVEFSNPIDGIDYALVQKSGEWSRPNKKYYRDWTVTAKLNGEIAFQHHLDLKGKNVIISFGSKALGDTLAWMPYVEEFQKKHECIVYCSTWWNSILDYPGIKFIQPGDGVDNVGATYEIGCFDNQLDRNVANWRATPLQKVAADILGLDYEPLRTRLKYTPEKKGGNGHEPKPYVCFSEFSTMRLKLWNRDGAWQKIIDYLVDLGYDCVSISAEQTQLQNVISHNGQDINRTITDISGAAFYIGLNAGPTWIAYSLGIPAIMLTGASEPWNDFPNPYRIAVDVCRPGCFNDTSIPIERGWEWCPRNKNYACTREITEEMVIEKINEIRRKLQAEEGVQSCHSNQEAIKQPSV